MPESGTFYEEILYPLQNGVLNSLADCGTPFYLTGGTALHRHYFRDRYSDDLDFFVNQDDRFGPHVDTALDALQRRGFDFDEPSFFRGDDYARAVICAGETRLRLDFVNDVATRFGDLEAGALFPRIDSLRNILSNKVTAVYRLAAKDFADLRTIARRTPFHWRDVMAEAARKLGGMDAAEVADLFRSFPFDHFENVQWRRRPNPSDFLADLAQMADDLIRGGPNSLHP